MDTSSSVSYSDKKNWQQAAANFIAPSAFFLAIGLLSPNYQADDHSAYVREFVMDGALLQHKNALVDSIMGKYAFVKITSEDLIRYKQQDLKYE